jgi:signal transduction histidine kinase/ABC-type sugar transport system substrate-binding protein/CheY-like chemotaxis protein
MHRRLKTYFSGILVMMLVLLLLTACRSRKKYVIGVSQCSEDIWREKLNRELLIGTYYNDQISIRFASANDNSKLQMRQISRFVADGVDLLIISPNQLSTISTAINEAHKKGIPIILFDRKSDTDNFTAFIGADNYAMGRAMGEYIAMRLHGHGNIMEIMGLEGSSPAIERHQGFMSAMQRYPDLHVIGRCSGNWLEASGRQAMDSLLALRQDVDAVFAQNDRMAMGARASVAQHRLRRPLLYFGIDGLASRGGGIEAVRDGKLAASYIYPTNGDLVIRLAMNILQGKPYKRENYLQSALVTTDNARVLLMQAEEMNRQSQNLEILHEHVRQYSTQYDYQRIVIFLFAILLFLLLVLGFYIYRMLIQKMHLNRQLEKQNEANERQRAELEKGYVRQQDLIRKVEQITQAQMTFFTNVSHELRTPLTLIGDPIRQLLSDTRLEADQHALLSMVERNAKLLQQLVNDILDFRKMQDDKLTLSLQQFDLAQALTSWVHDFDVAARSKQIDLQVAVMPSDTLCPIVADKAKLARVVYNLLNNALKFTPDGGTIRVALTMASGLYRITVSDTGIGISEADQPHVFDKFYQATDTIGGTGIGLSLVRSFVELHHGVVSVESVVGKGSTFTIVLPTSQNTAAASLTPSTEEAETLPPAALPAVDDVQKLQQRNNLQQLSTNETERPVVLIIEDNADMREYIATILHDRYDVIEAENGQTGLLAAVRKVPDLIVCDVMMPVMDGLELCRRVKSTTATSHIPVILLTARSLDEQQTEGYESGADSYIKKPFTREMLLARIGNLLANRDRLRQCYQDGDVASLLQANDGDPTFLQRLHKVIDSELADSSFGVEQMAQGIHLSRIQLYRKVKAMTGFSPADLLRNVRLEAARSLFDTTDLNVSQVSARTGFASLQHFNRCFKEMYHSTPSDYKKNPFRGSASRGKENCR